MSSANTEASVKLSKRDFESDNDVRWCPGCGDYSILANVQRALPAFGVPREKFVFVSGIGCSSRFPYYVNTYGFHGIHGRAPAIATGLKLARPDLHVWVVTGDGDGLSIGGNHLIHALRRNIGLKILLFNNRIYGLTKGQYSPTSEIGKITKSSPTGSIDPPFRPISVALGCEATFVARCLDTDAKMMQRILAAAQEHEGTAFIELYQNCPVFNDGAYSDLSERATRDDNVLALEHGQKMLFGAAANRGVILRDGRMAVATIGEDGITIDDILVHDERDADPSMAFWLSRFDRPAFPVPMGIFRRVESPTYEQAFHGKIASARDSKGRGDLAQLLASGDTWTVQ